MFTPSREQSRRYFSEVWRKYQAKEPLAGLEVIVLDVILAHPEYHTVLGELEAHVERDYAPETGAMNPFLHLGLHVAIEEQLSIDQPPGIHAEYQRLASKLARDHDAKHEILECLAQTLWQAQRTSTAPDSNLYLDCLRRK
jgi:Domain of unknown function (DUF1841)